jgi:hypothetical protein
MPSHAAEATVLLPPVEKIRRRNSISSDVVLGQLLPNDGERVWIVKAQRLEKHGVGHGENRGVGADSEGESESENGHGGEGARLAKLAKREAEILPELLSPQDTPNFSGVFLRSRYVSKLSQSRVIHLFGRHPTLDIFLRGPLEMFPDLLVQIVQPPFPPLHSRPSVGRRIRAIASASVSHLLVSAANCFRPFAVKL